MRIRFLAILGTAGALVLSACDSGADTSKVRNASVTNSNSNIVAAANGSESAPAVVNDPTNQAPDSALGARTNSLQRKLEAAKNAGVGPEVDPRELAEKNARPAPENSTFTSYLADVGYEIRKFKNHPQLLKVEKRIESDGKQSLKVFMRNGRVIDLPGHSISPLSTASSASILQAAGQGPAAPTKGSNE